SRIEILRTEPKPPERGIEDAEALVVCGRGVRRREDIAMLQALADALGGRVAATRAVVEAGWLDAKCQIGISGRTVKPKLIVTCGVSGAIQFVSGMSAAGTIVAINTAKDAPIFSVAHIGIVGDLYDVVPALTGEILARKESSK
ncbi:MAG: electron transfer flavoprotein subunit alpha/FixB family protein, partial [Kiritimatiellae bacterium]|nr:electron transfer flavoprotein subunit alpha/FixB family protein [Kiritimatiellia bacterium]